MAHLKQGDAAVQLGVDRPVLSKVENGHTLADRWLVEKMADVYHAPYLREIDPYSPAAVWTAIKTAMHEIFDHERMIDRAVMDNHFDDREKSEIRQCIASELRCLMIGVGTLLAMILANKNSPRKMREAS